MSENTSKFSDGTPVTQETVYSRFDPDEFYAWGVENEVFPAPEPELDVKSVRWYWKYTPLIVVYLPYRFLRLVSATSTTRKQEEELIYKRIFEPDPLDMMMEEFHKKQLMKDGDRTVIMSKSDAIEEFFRRLP